jgi:hypothetical protein
MADDAEHTRDGLQKRAPVEFDTPIQTATINEDLGHQAASATIVAVAIPAVERTNLVRPAAAPIEGEPVPDFEEMADQIRAR